MNMTTASRPIEILLIEDNPGDVRLTREALEDAKVLNALTVVSDGVDAMAFLRRQGKYHRAARPHLILLDLNLPKKDGREVITEIKQDPTLKSIPVVILTSSKAEEDIVKTYGLGANCYVTKPVDLERFLTVVRAVERFWLTIVELPPQGAQDDE